MMKSGKKSPACYRVWDDVFDERGARWSRPTTASARLETLHGLYEQLGSLGAVGRQVGLTRERVRQLLVKGAERGLFAYTPRRYPYMSKEQIIAGYTEIQSLSRMARLYRMSENHLKKLLAEYSITEPQLARYRMEGRRARCRAEYLQMVEQTGRHLSSGDLHRHPAGLALYARIIRCWGSIYTFRRALKIPNPPRLDRRAPDTLREVRKVRGADMPPALQQRRVEGRSLEVSVG